MRLSGKTIINQAITGPITNSDFEKPEFEGAIRDKGYDAIFEKAYLCPCKSKGSTDHLNICKNCGGVGWIFCNPTKTKFIITGIAAESKLREAALREWGLIDGGVVNVTALNENKLSFMDRVRLLDATAEHNQILYPQETDDETQFFAYTQYDIVSIDNITLFVDEETQLQRLSPNTDYSFRDNVYDHSKRCLQLVANLIDKIVGYGSLPTHYHYMNGKIMMIGRDAELINNLQDMLWIHDIGEYMIGDVDATDRKDERYRLIEKKNGVCTRKKWKQVNISWAENTKPMCIRPPVSAMIFLPTWAARNLPWPVTIHLTKQRIHIRDWYSTKLQVAVYRCLPCWKTWLSCMMW